LKDNEVMFRIWKEAKEEDLKNTENKVVKPIDE
jgi:hypothetical protein